MHPSRFIVLASATALIASIGIFNTSTAHSRQPERQVSRNTEVVALVTGDQVLLQNNRVLATLPGVGRKGMAFMQQKDQGDIYVIPVDAAPLVASGRVDRRLFNVSKLSEYRFGDIPLIVTYEPSVKSTPRSQLGLRSINGEAIHIANADATAFWSDAVGPRTLKAGRSKIWLDAPVHARLDRSVAQIGAPAAWQAGYTGKGVTVAVLDTGIDGTHPDLADAVVSARDFTDSETGTRDVVGHGTHVAGIITGNGSASDSKYVGVALDAKLLVGKVLGDSGSGSESGIIAGMEWAANEGADVINMSLSTDGPGDGTAPMDLALNRLTAQTGALFVVAAGNNGPAEMTVGSPGSAEAALTVGAVDRADALAPFSSRGPLSGSLGLKPDITAPGVNIVSPLADGSLLGEQFPVVDGKYLQLSGTSMATPHVAGAAAILVGQHRDWDGDRLKSALMNSSKPSGGLTAFEQGAGRLDVARAVHQSVVALPASLSNGVVQWPHHDDQPIGKAITYHNDGEASVTLKVSVVAPDAPAGMFTLDRSQITVPARGTAQVRLVTNTAVPAADRAYDGAVVAADGQSAVRTPFGVVREVESYNVSMSVLNRAGQLTADYFARFLDVAAPVAAVPYDESGKLVARLPKGRYYFDTLIRSTDSTSPTGQDTSIFVEPELAVVKDLNLVLDARQAKAIGAKLDRSEAKAARAFLEFHRGTAWGDTGLVLFLDGSFDGYHARPSTTPVASGTFTFTMMASYARPDGSGGFASSPYLYHINTSTNGRVPMELTQRIRDRDLATVQTRIASANPGEIVSKDLSVELTTPATLTELYTPGKTWRPLLAFHPRPGDFEFDGLIESAAVTYKQGKPIVERWNVGVFGPSIGDNTIAERSGDELLFNLPLVADQPLNHSGDSLVGATNMTLSRNGQVIGENPANWGTFLVPPGPGPFQLSVTSIRPTTFSSEMSVKWTFQAPAGQLPLMAVRFAPNLDDHNRAKAGRLFAVPVHVQQNQGAAQGELKDLRVSVSYDDGKTWRPVLLIGKGSSRTALLLHPRGKGFVSLRATAADSKGNKLEQTIVHAYELTP